MSWDEHVASLMGGVNVTAAGIFDPTHGTAYSCSGGFSPSPEETKLLMKILRGGMYNDEQITCSGTKYMYMKPVEGFLTLVSKGEEEKHALTISESARTVCIVVCLASSAGNSRESLHKYMDYLSKIGY